MGRSAKRTALSVCEFGQLAGPTLILGGVHGDEPKSVYLTLKLIEHLAEGATSPPEKPTHVGGVVVVPIVNPDGYQRRNKLSYRRCRQNSRGVDLNRNFPTADWQRSRSRSRYYGGERPASEPETRALVRLIERIRPRQIITVHSIDGHRHCNNFDGPGRPLARLLARFNRYPVRATIGYPTPGSLGTWAGLERNIPTITLELPSHHSPRRCWDDNRRALLAAMATEIPVGD